MMTEDADSLVCARSRIDCSIISTIFSSVMPLSFSGMIPFLRSASFHSVSSFGFCYR